MALDMTLKLYDTRLNCKLQSLVFAITFVRQMRSIFSHLLCLVSLSLSSLCPVLSINRVTHQVSSWSQKCHLVDSFDAPLLLLLLPSVAFS